jgi:hypothetical protein
MTNKQEMKDPYYTTTYTYTKCTVGYGTVQYENVPEDDDELRRVMKAGSMIHFNDGMYCIYHWGTHHDSKIHVKYSPYEHVGCVTYYTRHAHIRHTVDVDVETVDKFVEEYE